ERGDPVRPVRKTCTVQPTVKASASGSAPDRDDVGELAGPARSPCAPYRCARAAPERHRHMEALSRQATPEFRVSAPLHTEQSVNVFHAEIGPDGRSCQGVACPVAGHAGHCPLWWI